jgi:hypothetical protein
MRVRSEEADAAKVRILTLKKSTTFVQRDLGVMNPEKLTKWLPTFAKYPYGQFGRTVRVFWAAFLTKSEDGYDARLITKARTSRNHPHPRAQTRAEPTRCIARAHRAQ